MSVKSKLVFSDEITYRENTNYIDYSEVKIKNFDKLNGGIFKMIAVYIYILTIASILFFVLAK